MKSVFRLSVFSLFCAGISLVVLASEAYRETILKEAALRSGYLLPAEVNQPFDPKKSALGKVFFESTELSFNSNTSCSTCHLDEFSSADGLPIAIGIEGHGKGRERAMGGGSIVPRNTLALWGRAARQFDTFFWDGKVQKTENGIVSQFGDQVPSDDPLIVAVSLPFVEIREMVSDDQYVQEKLMTETVSSAEIIQRELASRVVDVLGKGDEVEEAFGLDGPNVEFIHITRSLKHFFADKFQVGESRFSRFIAGEGELTKDEVNGGLIFFGKGKCAVCHSGPHFSDFDFHTVVFPQAGFGKNGFGVDYGRFNVTFDPSDLHKFRTPPLHNVAQTSPYGHSGSVASLEDAIVAHYDPLSVNQAFELDVRGRRELFDRLRAVGAEVPISAPLSHGELDDLTQFLGSLSF